MTAPKNSLEACDFTRSFVRFRIDITRKMPTTVSHPPPWTVNNVRMPLECLATVTREGRSHAFGLSASCKTERVFVERGIWTEPNADMCAVAGDGQFMVVTRYDRAKKGVMLHPPSLGEKPDRQCVDPAEALDALSLDVRRRPARRLESLDAIIEALKGDRELVSRTVYSAEGAEVAVEYPVKTANFSERDRYYQVDTGPVLFFGEATGSRLIERLHLAYVAHLGGDWAEFLVSRPTPLESLPVSVHHFSESRRVPSENSVWLVDG